MICFWFCGRLFRETQEVTTIRECGKGISIIIFVNFQAGESADKKIDILVAVYLVHLAVQSFVFGFQILDLASQSSNGTPACK